MSIQKVLIADDETYICSFVERKLKKLGYEVYTAENGKIACDQAMKHLPDIILMDVKMPVMTGYEAAKILKSSEETKHIPIIMISAKAQTTDIRNGIDSGADKYLTKPVGLPDILDAINEFE